MGRHLEHTLHERADLRDMLPLIARAHRVPCRGITRRVQVIEIQAVIALPLKIEPRRQPVRE